MKKRLLFSLIMFFGCSLSMIAQDRRITGKVVSAGDSSPLPGVSVQVKGTSKGTATDATGNFSINVPTGKATLEIRSVGFVNRNIEVGSQTVINVALEESDNSLGEVVVVGYGTTKKTNLMGNVAQINSKQIENLPVLTAEQAIQGRAAGVFVESGNGKVGQGIKMRVRGATSVSGGNDPLYVIDGIPMTVNAAGSAINTPNPLADINFNDIESIEILKDASSAAIYGARGSNGVVLLTTKKGKAGKTNFTLNYFTGTSEPTNRRGFLNTAQYVELFKEARANAGFSVAGGENRFTRYGLGEKTRWSDPASPNYTDTNWENEVLRKGNVKQLDFSVNGGTDKTKFYGSASYMKQEGIIIKNAFDRLSTRFNLDHKATDKLTIGINASLARSFNTRLSNDNAFSTPMQIIALAPISPVIDPRTNDYTDTYNGADVTQYYNPLLSIRHANNTSETYRTLGNVYAQYVIIPNLSFRTEYGFDMSARSNDQYNGKKTVRNSVNAGNGEAIKNNINIFNFTTNNYFTYNKIINQKHDLNVVVGTSFQQSKRTSVDATGRDLPSDSYKTIASAATKADANSFESSFAFLSYFARVNYKLNEKYLFGLSGRIDGSSRLSSNNLYASYPAVSVGWIASEENFLKEVRQISLLKLRASYGFTGNAETGTNFGSLGLFTGTGYAGTPAQRPLQLENPDLTWEKTGQTDIGLEIGLFNNRISAEIDYYSKQTTGIILNVNVPGTTGFASQLKNVGKLENKGWEFILRTDNKFGDLTWRTSINAATNANKILDLQGQVITGGFLNRAVEGEALGVFFGPEYAGVDPDNGDALYFKNTKKADGSLDKTKTNDVNTTENVTIGNPNPTWIGGFTNDFSYKGIDLSITFQGVYGNDVYNGAGKFMSANGDFYDNQTLDQMNRWRKKGDITNVPQARYVGGNGTAESSRYLENASYTRLKTITLGYNLPKSITDKLKLSKIRVYATANNLMTFTKYSGWDPEVNTDYLTGVAAGNDFYSAPQPKTIIVGLNLGF
jgi:TonB-dependent starch-binding outer membrane protein SusC